MPAKMKIKKGDTVVVISGDDRGKTAKVLAAFPAARRVLIEGVGMTRRHRRPRKAGQKGETISAPARIDVSRIMLRCSHCARGVRVGYRSLAESNSAARVCKRCHNSI